MGDEKQSTADATRVDLGDDLLEKTAMLVVDSETTASPSPTLSTQEIAGETQGEYDQAPGVAQHSADDFSAALDIQHDPKANVSFGSAEIPDFLENAKILVSEGFSKDAKKILHKILFLDPGNVTARQILEEVRALELKQIFGEGEARRPIFGRKNEDFLADVDSEDLMRKLDLDLNLGMSQSFSLFEDQALMDSFCAKMEKELIQAQTSPQDWIDLGIGFLEMNLYFVSTRLFQGAYRRLDPTVPETRQTVLSASCLLALSQILAGKPFDAVSCLQPLVRDNDIKKEDKIEVYYLLGRTYESMKRQDLAFYYYKQVVEIQPHYRDIDQRLKVV